MKRLLFFLFLLISVTAKSQTSQSVMADSVKMLLDKSLQILQQNAINRDSVDWTALRSPTRWFKLSTPYFPEKTKQPNHSKFISYIKLKKTDGIVRMRITDEINNDSKKFNGKNKLVTTVNDISLIIPALLITPKIQ